MMVLTKKLRDTLVLESYTVHRKPIHKLHVYCPLDGKFLGCAVMTKETFDALVNAAREHEETLS